MATCEATRIPSLLNWLIGSVLKHCKVLTYYDQDCTLSLKKLKTQIIMRKLWGLLWGKFHSGNKLVLNKTIEIPFVTFGMF